MEVQIVDIHVDWKANTRGMVSEADAEELAKSIASIGLINPVTIKLSDPTVTSKPYTLVAGYTRFMACRKYLNWTSIETNLTDADEFWVSVEENLKRNNLTMYQEALYLKRWVEELNLDARTIAAKINRPVTWVNARIKLLELDTETQRLADSPHKVITQQEVVSKWTEQMKGPKIPKVSEPRISKARIPHKKKDPRPRLNAEMQDVVRQLVDKGEAGSAIVIILNWACGLVPNSVVINEFGVDVE